MQVAYLPKSHGVSTRRHEERARHAKWSPRCSSTKGGNPGRGSRKNNSRGLLSDEVVTVDSVPLMNSPRVQQDGTLTIMIRMPLVRVTQEPVHLVAPDPPAPRRDASRNEVTSLRRSVDGCSLSRTVQTAPGLGCESVSARACWSSRALVDVRRPVLSRPSQSLQPTVQCSEVENETGDATQRKSGHGEGFESEAMACATIQAGTIATMGGQNARVKAPRFAPTRLNAHM